MKDKIKFIEKLAKSMNEIIILKFHWLRKGKKEIS